MKTNSLRSEINRIKNHPLCKISRNIVIGEGNKKAKIMIIGQNPGEEEDKTGRPFVGKSGKFLNKVLEKNKIKRESLYITNVVNCKTPENRKPTKKEIEFFMPLLLKQISMIKPKIIILLGDVAWHVPRIKGIKYFEIYHPAAAMRFAKFRKRFESDFKKLKIYRNDRT
jgi:DNA polymerase